MQPQDTAPEVTPAMRAAVGGVVEALAAGLYEQLVQDGRAGRLSAEQLERAVREYGRALRPLPDEAWTLVETYLLEDGSGIAIDVPMWTVEEGRSDLTLSVSWIEMDGGARIEIDDLHVL